MIKKIVLFGLCLFFFATPASAQESVSLAVVPPIIQIGMEPGDYWASSLKVVNTNLTPLTVYANPMDFRAEGEAGHGKFEPVTGNDAALLAAWMEIARDPVTIPPGESREIPFALNIPEDAPPGGHYAAILIGTKPFGSQATGGPTVKVSSFVSSLFLVRIAGEVTERGSIREFSTDRRWYDSPDVKFSLRFENSGNVHIQPQGEITIYNMWGKERGEVFLNRGTDLGQVLPQSVRKFEFEWNSDGSFFDIGKYTAIATLAYGKEARQSVTRTLSFWIIPVRETVSVLGGFGAILILLIWGIRRYVRRALELEIAKRKVPGDGPVRPLRALVAPLAQGVVDLRASRSSLPVPERGMGWTFRKYRLPLTIAIVAMLVSAWLFGFFRSVLQPERSFELRTEDSQISTPER